MNISRLKRTLAVFLSVAMLMMCMPFGGITASAAGTVDVDDIVSGSITELSVGDTVTCYDEITYNTQNYSGVTLCFNDPSVSDIDLNDVYSWANSSPSVAIDTSYTPTAEIEATYGNDYSAESYWKLEVIGVAYGELNLLFLPDKYYNETKVELLSNVTLTGDPSDPTGKTYEFTGLPELGDGYKYVYSVGAMTDMSTALTKSSEYNASMSQLHLAYPCSASGFNDLPDDKKVQISDDPSRV